MPQSKTVELETTEALLLAVALREYLNGDTRHGLGSSSTFLRDHPTSRAVIGMLSRRQRARRRARLNRSSGVRRARRREELYRRRYK